MLTDLEIGAPGMDNPLWRMTTLYKISTKQAKTKTFFHNKAQADLHRKWTGRGIILKARQLGMSTYFLIRNLDKVLWTPNTWCAIIAHEQKTLEILFSKIQFAFDNLPPDIKNILPQPRTDNKYELFFRELNSKIYVALEVQGGTNQIVHFSEYAQTDEKRIEATLPTVPPDGEIIIESIPWGFGNRFHKEYLAAKKNESEYQAFFYEWWWDETDYKLPVKTVKQDNLTSEENKLIENFNVTHEQIEWRRAEIKKLERSDGTNMFPQYYPEDDQTCFLASGKSVFDLDILKDQYIWLNKTKPAYLQGYITFINNRPKFVEDKKGPLKVFEVPQKHEQYVIGADVSEGLNTSDWQAVEIGSRSKKVQAAEYRIKTETAAFAQDLYFLHLWYNKAYLCPERNAVGRTIIDQLVDYGIQFYIYAEDEKIKVRRKPVGVKLGFYTGTNTKRDLAALAQNSLRESEWEIQSTDLIEEMMKLQKTSIVKGRAGFEADSGSHDDLVMAWCLMQEMDRVLPRYVPPIQHFKDSWEESFQQARLNRNALAPSWEGI